MAKIQLEPLRGMRDVVPPESEDMEFVIESFCEIAKRYGYRRIFTPTLERFELFALKSGEEIRKTMYVFVDKGGREVALRPEFTPSVVRAYLRLMKAEPKPIRLYYVGPVFRYDEPQRGRYREFYQAGVEVLGADSLYYDVELFEILADFYREIGLRGYRFKVNNIAIVRSLAKVAGLSESEEETLLHLLDKGLVDDAINMLKGRNPSIASALRALNEYRRVEISSLNQVVSRVRECLGNVVSAVDSQLRELEQLIEALKGVGITNVYVDLAFARGIAYYTGTIFEVEVPKLGLSIAGGGRYDDLTVVYGGPSLKMTGFAIGVERTVLALKCEGMEGATSSRVRTLLMCVGSLQELAVCNEVAESLRGKGVIVQLELIDNPKRISRFFEYASKRGFRFAIVIGKREVEQGVVTVKDLATWVQKSVDPKELPEVIERGLST